MLSLISFLTRREWEEGREERRLSKTLGSTVGCLGGYRRPGGLLASNMGGHRNTIGKLERGETSFTFDYVVEVARALKVRPSVFFDFSV